MESQYITSATRAGQFPALNSPEVAFVGRSNCGKSSLLNALLERRQLARASSTPGRTQMAHFFRIHRGRDIAEVVFTDLPGYGFSAASRNITRSWAGLLEDYIERDNLCALLFLADCRRELSESELTYLGNLPQHLAVMIVLTKADKIPRGQYELRRRQVSAQLTGAGVRHLDPYIVSTSQPKSLEQLRNAIWSWCDSSSANLAPEIAKFLGQPPALPGITAEPKRVH